jgi:hypothetical protein
MVEKLSHHGAKILFRIVPEIFDEPGSPVFDPLSNKRDTGWENG